MNHKIEFTLYFCIERKELIIVEEEEEPPVRLCLNDSTSA